MNTQYTTQKYRQTLFGLFALFFQSVTSASIIDPAVESLTLSGILTPTPMAVAYIPSVDRYYAVTGGYTPVPAHVYDNTGTRLGTSITNVDMRGLYYNPNTIKLETVSWNAYSGSGSTQGILSLNLNILGDYTGTTTQLLAAPIPALGSDQTMPSYDPFRNYLYAKDNDTVNIVRRSNGSLVSTITLDLATAGVPLSNINWYFIGFTGVTGHELVVLDHEHKKVLVFNLAGNYVGSSSLPADLDVSQAVSYGTGYTNSRFFIYDATVEGYRSFKVLSMATETLTLKGSVDSVPMSVAYIPSLNRYYAASGNYTSSPAYIYNGLGTQLSSGTPGVDSRGIYFNPTTKQLESVSYNAFGGSSPESGILSLNLDLAGDFIGDNTQLIAGPIPALGNSQTMPSYDPYNNLLYAKVLNTVKVVKRSNGALDRVITLDVAAADVTAGDLNGNFVGFTAVTGQELAVLDKSNGRILIFDLDGNYVKDHSLPANLDVTTYTASNYGNGFANNQFFIYDTAVPGYRGFRVTPAPEPDIKVADSITATDDKKMAFDTVTVGESSKQAIVTLSNIGYPLLAIANIALDGTAASHFSLDLNAGNNPCDATAVDLKNAISCTVGVNFAPQTAGDKSATLVITSNDPDEDEVSIMLSGTGVLPPDVTPPATGGGGGCSLLGHGSFDPLLPLLLLLGVGYLYLPSRCRKLH